MNSNNIDVAAIMRSIQQEAETRYQNRAVLNDPSRTVTKSSDPDNINSTETNQNLNRWKNCGAVDINELIDLEGEDFIRECFCAILNREPDEGGLQNYLGAMKNGRSKAEIISDLRNSEEGCICGKIIYGYSELKLYDLIQFEDRDFITNCYYQILRRGPDPAGMRLFLDQLRSGECEKAEIISQLLNSEEAGNNANPITISELTQEKTTKTKIREKLQDKLSKKELIAQHGLLFGRIEDKLDRSITDHHNEISSLENRVNAQISTLNMGNDHKLKELVSREESNKEEIDFLKDELIETKKNRNGIRDELRLTLTEFSNNLAQELYAREKFNQETFSGIRDEITEILQNIEDEKSDREDAEHDMNSDIEKLSKKIDKLEQKYNEKLKDLEKQIEVRYDSLSKLINEKLG